MSEVKHKVLVVDDSSAILGLVQGFLNDMDIGSHESATNGETAWHMIVEAHENNQPYTAIISDIYMPIIDGLQLLEMCKRDNRFANTPFLIITTETEKAKVLQALVKGVSNYIVKPFHKNDLEKKLMEAIAASQKSSRSA